MSNRDVEINPTVSFRHPSIPDQVIGEHKSGFQKLEVKPAGAEVSAILPPAPTREPPQTSIASRLRAKFEQRSE